MNITKKIVALAVTAALTVTGLSVAQCRGETMCRLLAQGRPGALCHRASLIECRTAPDPRLIGHRGGSRDAGPGHGRCGQVSQGQGCQ